MTNDNDMALAALLKAAEMDASLPTELLRKSFAIQRRHQFDPMRLVKSHCRS